MSPDPKVQKRPISKKIILGGSLLQNQERKRENNVLSAENVPSLTSDFYCNSEKK